jgi:hypothetical protein
MNQLPLPEMSPEFDFEEFPDFDVHKSVVLLLGSINHEGITSSLRASGEQYKQKLLASTVENWHSIVRILRFFMVRAVIVKLNASAYENFAHPAYKGVRDELLSFVSKVPHMFFVYEDILSGAATEESLARQEDFIRRRGGGDPDDELDLSWYRQLYGFGVPRQEVLNEAEGAFKRFDITLVPYRMNADVTNMSVQFLHDALNNLLFKVYIPIGRLWANEVDRLLNLFKDYLSSTGRTGIRLSQSKTNHGTSYEFHSTDHIQSISLEAEFKEFTRVLNLSLSDPRAAEEALISRSVDAKQVEAIVTRYAKEAYRLSIDIKHERERKLLSVRQRLESELTGVLPPTDWARIQALADRAIPSSPGTSPAFAIDSAPLPSPTQYQSVTLNLNPQIIQQVTGIVAQEIRGNGNIGASGEELLATVEKYGSDRSLELASAVHEIADSTVPRGERLTSLGKLKTFFYSLGPEVGKVGLNILSAYAEHKMGLK